MTMSNYMIVSSLTAALSTLIRINWGWEARCTCTPSSWPLPGLLSLNWEGSCRKSWASSVWTLHFLDQQHPGNRWMRCKMLMEQQRAILETACCAVGAWTERHLQWFLRASKKNIFTIKKYCRLEGFGFGCVFFVCFWSFARHTGFVAAGKMQIMVLV